jgi:hypothetical protein
MIEPVGLAVMDLSNVACQFKDPFKEKFDPSITSLTAFLKPSPWGDAASAGVISKAKQKKARLSVSILQRDRAKSAKMTRPKI